jgi:hypothetical protein
MGMNLLVAVAISLATVAPQYKADRRMSLAGIPSMRVIVEKLSVDALEEGLSIEQLKTDVELKLRLAGIKVISQPYVPYLYVRVSYLKQNLEQGPKIGFSCMIEVEFKQLATLLLNSKLTLVTTWDAEYLMGGPLSDSQNQVRQQVRDLVDEFLNDYLSVNPK